MTKYLFLLAAGLLTTSAVFAMNRPVQKNQVQRAPQNQKYLAVNDVTPYGEARFKAVVLARRQVAEPGSVSCYVTLRVVKLQQNRYQPIQNLENGQIVENVLDTPLCDLRVNTVVHGILIDNNYAVNGQKSLMIETI